MKKLILTILVSINLYANGLIPFVGMAMNDERLESEPPLGIFGIRYDTDYTSTYYRHLSSIPQINESQGLNELGFKVKYKYKMIEPYIGVTFTNKNISSIYYTDKLGYNNYNIGITIDYKDKELYIECRKSDNSFCMIGFNLLFI